MSPGGPLVFQGGYHPRKKIHVIRVVFQDQTMYARTSFRVSKNMLKGMKILYKYVFRVCYKNLLKSYVTHVFLFCFVFFFNDPFRTCDKFDKIPGY